VSRAAPRIPRLRPDSAPVVAAAREARSHAYAPYSGFRVGAALVTRRGSLYTGCNVENASYGATLCAERCAIAAMVAAGESDPVACAVVAGRAPKNPKTENQGTTTPCGICRQVLSEFAEDMIVWLATEDDSGRIVARKTTRLAALLPQAFHLNARKK
jgi:cytidine deaminase